MNRENLQEVQIPGGYARAFKVRSGQYLSIIDVGGKQTADFIAFNEKDRNEFLSPHHTRVSLMSLRLRIGDRLRTNLRRPIFEIVEDMVGRHDLLIPACDKQRYLVDYGVKDHRNCVDNFLEALSSYGIAKIPDPVNIFQNTEFFEDGRLVMKNSLSKANDKIVFLSLMDTLCAVSACPMDLNPVGGDRVTDILVRVQDKI